jgi:hypothetical protein
MRKLSTVILLATFSMAFTLMPNYYPIDGYSQTGIRRLLPLQMVISGEIVGTKPVAGALKSINDIKLNLTELKGDSLLQKMTIDQALQLKVNALFPNMHESYSISLLDITPGKPMRYAARQDKWEYQPGSVGKIAIAVAFFRELKNIYPNSFEKRQQLMREKYVVGGNWVLTDDHTIPVFDEDTKKLVKRMALATDNFTLYEWIDHMMSVSNNGAASLVWREALLMHVFGDSYPALTTEQANEYFKNTPKSELSNLAIQVVNDPLRELGITENEWRLGSFFTYGAGNIIPPKGGSTGTTNGLMKFMVSLEQGKVVDMKSSLEIKRLMYMTDRRIRYASSTALAKAAVYFKSGSLYSCMPEEGYACAKYKGNKANYMNSVAIVEHPDGTTYMVCLMSNVLKKNSSGDHFAIASSIDRLLH